MRANQEGDSVQLESGKTMAAHREARTAPMGWSRYFNIPKKFKGQRTECHCFFFDDDGEWSLRKP